MGSAKRTKQEKHNVSDPNEEKQDARAGMPTSGTRRGEGGTHTWSKALIGARKMMAVAGIGNEVRASAPESAFAHKPTPGQRTLGSASIYARATYHGRGRHTITACAPGRAAPCPRMGT